MVYTARSMRLTRTHSLLPAGRLPFRNDASFSTWILGLYDRAQASERGGSPSSNPYALRPDTLSFFRELLEDLAPRKIIEFGSGESTVAFSEWSAGRDVSLTSVENDPSWIRTLETRLAADRRPVLFVYAPLHLKLRRGRAFLTYEKLEALKPRIREADFVFLDGPQASGREAVLYEILGNCKVGAIVALDDFNLYFVRDMLGDVPNGLASSFVGTAIESNSHGLYLLRCVEPQKATPIPTVGPVRVAQSYWRTLNDFIKY
jgi:predicted O-methyltransferase YrrM